MTAMTTEELRATLGESSPPANLALLLQALWWDAKGNFDRAHEIAQDDHSRDGAWIHAYLHRKEGDEGNAGYWYGQAHKPHPRVASNEEWQQIATALLSAARL